MTKKKMELGDEAYDTRSDARVLLDAFIEFKWYILVVAVLSIGIGYYFGFELPEITLGRIVTVSVSLMGIPVGAVVWNIVKKRLPDKRVEVDLIPDSGKKDTIKVPEDEFHRFEVIGRKLPTRTKLNGRKVYGVKMIDLDNKVLIPAKDIPEDTEAPDNWELLSEAYESIRYNYREMLVEYAQKYNQMNTDEQVIKEKAKAESGNMIGESLEDSRMANIETEHPLDDIPVDDVDTLLKEAQMQENSSEGGDDE